MYFIPDFFIPRVSPGVIIIEPLRGSLYLQIRICICFRSFRLSDFRTSRLQHSAFRPGLHPGIRWFNPFGVGRTLRLVSVFSFGLEFHALQSTEAADLNIRYSKAQTLLTSGLSFSRLVFVFSPPTINLFKIQTACHGLFGLFFRTSGLPDFPTPNSRLTSPSRSTQYYTHW